MKKTTMVMLSVLALAFVLSGVAIAADAHAAAPAKTWTGEIVDLACYNTHSAKGAGHTDCAKKCVKNGQPVGLATADGDLFLLSADHADGKPFEAVKDMAGSNAQVTGTMAEKGGIKMITVTGVKPAA
jgi:hypothetical protein